MKANFIVFSDGAERMAYLDQERGVNSDIGTQIQNGLYNEGYAEC